MSLNVETRQPVFFQTDSPNLSLSQIKTLLPDAISIEAVIQDFQGYLAGGAIYRVLMPYKFMLPSTPVFGDRLSIDLFVAKNSTMNIEIKQFDTFTPYEVLAQDVVLIKDYNH